MPHAIQCPRLNNATTEASTLLARKNEQQANENAQREKVQREAVQRQLYVSQMNVAARAWEDHNAGRTLELLEAQVPERTGGVELRGWEWHHLWRLCHSELRKIDRYRNEFGATASLLTRRRIPDNRLLGWPAQNVECGWNA
jgi:hypothetical protein